MSFYSMSLDSHLVLYLCIISIHKVGIMTAAEKEGMKIYGKLNAQVSKCSTRLGADLVAKLEECIHMGVLSEYVFKDY